MIITLTLSLGCCALQDWLMTDHLTPSLLANVEHIFGKDLDRRLLLCPINKGELMSLDFPNAKQTKTQFHNSARDKVNIFWHDKNGNPYFKGVIPVNGFYNAHTWEGHAFRFWNADLSIVLLDFKVGHVPIGSGAVKNKTKIRNLHYQSNDVQFDLPHLDWNNAREVGFVNRMDKDVDLYHVNDKKQSEDLLVSKLSPGAVHYEITYHMHKFRARFHGEESGIIIDEFQIKDVEIYDCELPKVRNIRKKGEAKRVTVKEDLPVEEYAWTWAISNSSTFVGVYSI